MACLALSEQLSVPPLTEAFLVAANQRGFTVVEVPLAVPFMAISREVAAAVQGGYVLPVSGSRGTAGYILAMETAGAAPAGVSVVQHIATVAALQLSMQAHEREMLRREGAETLAEMLRGVLDTAVATQRLAVHGFPEGASLMLAIVRPTDPGADGDTVVAALAHGGFPQLVLRQEEELYVLIPDDRTARAALAASNTVVGTSLPFRARASLRVARREAQWAITRAVESGRDMVGYGDDRTGRWLTGESADLQALVDEVLAETWLALRAAAALSARQLYAQ